MKQQGELGHREDESEERLRAENGARAERKDGQNVRRKGQDAYADAEPVAPFELVGYAPPGAHRGGPDHHGAGGSCAREKSQYDKDRVEVKQEYRDLEGLRLGLVEPPAAFHGVSLAFPRSTLADMNNAAAPEEDSYHGAAVHPASQHMEDHHRDISGGTARAAVFGVSDGLVSNVALILGVAGAGPAPGVVRLAGLAGLIAGAVSMAAGEYVSVKAQVELLERELELERNELCNRPEKEERELAGIYIRRGVEPPLARQLAKAMSKNPDLALQTHAREELGVDPSSLGSPVKAAVASFISFAIGALIPLMPWFFATGTTAVIASVILGAIAAVTVGVALAVFTERPWPKSAARQLLIAAGAAAVTFGVGKIVGVGVG